MIGVKKSQVIGLNNNEDKRKIRRVIIDGWGDINDNKIGQSEGIINLSYRDPAYMYLYRDYVVLATDYENYAIMYYCNSYKNLLFQRKRKENVQIITRRPYFVNFEESHLDLTDPEVIEFLQIK